MLDKLIVHVALLLCTDVGEPLGDTKGLCAGAQPQTGMERMEDADTHTLSDSFIRYGRTYLRLQTGSLFLADTASRQFDGQPLIDRLVPSANADHAEDGGR